MVKCPFCKSCLKVVWINYKRYFYCDLVCLDYYDLVNGELIKLSEDFIKQERIKEIEYENYVRESRK
jgi:uncharacterized protein YuzB (UPF0349 family)